MQDPASPAAAPLTQDQQPHDAPDAASARLRPRRGFRWKRWAVLLATVVGLRLALPLVLGPMIGDRLSRVLGAEVDVGDVSFAPLDAIVTLRDVRVRTPGTLADGTHGGPAIRAARVTIDVQWLPLLHHELLVRELALESGRIDLARPTDAAGLTAMLHAEPARELPPGWTFALDRIVLRDTSVRIADVGDGDPRPLDLMVRDGEVSTLRRRPSAFGRSPNLRVDARVDGGRIRVDGISDLRDDGVVVDALVRLHDVPIARLEPYLAPLGWTAVAGRVSGHLRYQRDPGRRDLFSGRLEARRVALRVAALDEPALAIRRAVAEVDAIDLLQRRVALGSLTLHGARLVVRPDPAAPLPLLDDVAFAESPSARRHVTRREVAAQVAPWSWSVAHLETPFGRVVLAGNGGDVVLPASVSGQSLGPDAYWSPLHAAVGSGAHAAVFDGTLRLTQGLTIDGRLTASGVDAPACARALGLPLAELAQSGTASADLSVSIEPAAAKEPVDLHGKVTLADLWLAGPAPDEFALGAGAVELDLAGVDLGRKEPGGVVPTVLRFSDAVVSDPYAALTRTADGWIVPPFLPADAAAGEALDATTPDGVAPVLRVANAAGSAAPPAAAGTTATAAATAGAGVTAADDGAAPAAPPTTEAVVATVRSTPGRLVVVDRTMDPPATFDVALVDGSAQGVRLPGATLRSFVLQGSEPRLGTVQVDGSEQGERHELEVAAQDLPLAVVTPYLAQAGLPYRFVGGIASVLSQIDLAGGRWSADTTLTLRDALLLDDDGGTLRQSLGMSPEAALAALQDRERQVTLRLRLSSSADDPRTVADVVAGAVRDAVYRARRTPLPQAPIEIAFAPGSSQLSAQAGRQLATIARVLAARSDARIELDAGTSRADRRWIAEQAVVGDLEEPGGFMGVLRALGVRDRSERIRDALAERAAGHPGRLDEEDQAALDEMIADAPAIPDERLAALAAARLAHVADALATDDGVPASRMVLSQPVAGAGGAFPGVRATFSVDTRPARLASALEERP